MEWQRSHFKWKMCLLGFLKLHHSVQDLFSSPSHSCIPSHFLPPFCAQWMSWNSGFIKPGQAPMDHVCLCLCLGGLQEKGSKKCFFLSHQNFPPYLFPTLFHVAVAAVEVEGRGTSTRHHIYKGVISLALEPEEQIPPTMDSSGQIFRTWELHN